MDLWVDNGLHCGECLEVEINSEWVQTRIEMTFDGEWYLVDTPYKGKDLEYLQVRID